LHIGYFANFFLPCQTGRSCLALSAMAKEAGEYWRFRQDRGEEGDVIMQSLAGIVEAGSQDGMDK
ncbi:MAG TPA: hypothetical protein VL485_01305, partial [Ktedonobacteraceae bacterium]|nr:hypothetical protein [Ktedonobacteraceae bacterium]